MKKNKPRLTAQIAGAYINGVLLFEGKEYPVADCIGHDMAGCQLILIPLHDLTDTHAVEIARMAGFHDCQGRNLMVSWREGFMRKSIDLHELSVTDHSYEQDYDTVAPLKNSRQIMDHLRMLGYDCGYGDCESLIAAGIAVEAPEGNEIRATRVLELKSEIEATLIRRGEIQNGEGQDSSTVAMIGAMYNKMKFSKEEQRYSGFERMPSMIPENQYIIFAGNHYEKTMSFYKLYVSPKKVIDWLHKNVGNFDNFS